MVLPKFWFCNCNLKIGGFIIGSLGILSSIIQIILASYVLNKPGLLPNDTRFHEIRVCCWVSIVMSLIYMWLSIPLLCTHKGQRYLLVPWLLTVEILTFASIIIVLIIGGILFYTEQSFKGNIIYYLALSGCQIYFWMYVDSKFKKFLAEENAPAGLTSADASLNQATDLTTITI